MRIILSLKDNLNNYILARYSNIEETDLKIQINLLFMRRHIVEYSGLRFRARGKLKRGMYNKKRNYTILIFIVYYYWMHYFGHNWINLF
jgi:hypothetical protein